MSRPSLKTVRSAEILDAFEKCVARFGLEGATQDRIAEEAGVKRTLLRHYLGNRDEMIDALIDHVTAKFDNETALMVAALPDKDRVASLIKILFGPQGVSDINLVMVFQALSNASDQHPKARTSILGAVDRMVAAIDGELANTFPDADAKQRTAVAFGVTQLYFSIDSIAMLTPPASWWARAKSSAQILISSLEASQ